MDEETIFRLCKPIAQRLWKHDPRTKFQWLESDNEPLDAFQKLMESYNFNGHIVKDLAFSYGYDELDWRALVGTVDMPDTPIPPLKD